MIAIGKRVSGTKSLEAFGYLPLSDAADKHMLGEIANIIQHPQGQFKQIVLRENNLVARDETNEVLHYIADTEKGSSGSPVCNNDWEPIALHHWGGPGLELFSINGQPLRRDINEGIRISAIVRALRERAPRLDPIPSAAVTDLLALWNETPKRGPVAPENNFAVLDYVPTRPDGTAIAAGWFAELDLSNRDQRACAACESAARPSLPKCSQPCCRVSRKGPNALVAMRSISAIAEDMSAASSPGSTFLFRNSRPIIRWRGTCKRAATTIGMNCSYNHFSIFVNSKRRLAALTACNIDGSRVVAVKREDKTVKRNPTLRDLGVELLGPEASDDFSPDPRIPDHQQMAIEFYEEQEVPGIRKAGISSP